MLLYTKIEKRNVLVIPNIVTTEENKQSKTGINNRSNSETNDCVRIVYIGRIHRKKKIHDILYNLDNVSMPMPVLITIAGYCDDDLYMEELEEIANLKKLELNIQTNITEKQKISILNESDIFISLSDSENFGIVF